MKRIVFVFYLIVILPTLFIQNPALAEGGKQIESALEMANNCRPIAITERTGENRISIADKNLFCWGAFSAMQWAFTVYADSKSTTPTLLACLPTQSSRQQLIAVFVAYVNIHPEKMHLPYQEVIVSAMQTTYPCQK